MTDIEKAESHEKIVTAGLKTEKGQPRVVTSTYFIQQARREELKFPRCLDTYDCMNDDDAVFSSIDITNLHVANALNTGKFVGTGSQRSDDAAEFLNYNIRNLGYGTWLEAINNMNTDILYGFSLLNIVMEKRKTGEYAGANCLKKLAPRDQKTIFAWLFDEDYRETLGFIQKPNKKNPYANNPQYLPGGLTISNVTGPMYDGQYPVIRDYQLLHFKYNSINNNPQGDTPLNHCYKAWKEKSLVEQYEVIGVTKDFGGLLVLRVPSELIEQANDPANYPDSELEYRSLQEDAAKLHSGEGSMVVLTSDVDEASKKYLYDLELKGITGGGKQYNTSQIIDQKRKSIHNCFGTGFLLLGQDGSGSYALSTNATSTHGYYVQRNIRQKVDVLNNHLAKTILAANDVYLGWKDMPVFEAADPDEFDLDVMSKFIQRAKSVGGMTPQMMEYLAKKAKMPTEGIDKLDFSDPMKTKAGLSRGSSGTGNSQSGGKGSATNSANKSMDEAVRHLVKIDEYGDEEVFSDSVTGELTFIPKEQQ